MLSEKLLPTFKTKLAKKAAIGGITTAAFLSSVIPAYAHENEKESPNTVPIKPVTMTELERVEVALQPDATSEISSEAKQALDLLEIKRKIRDEKIPMAVTEEEMSMFEAKKNEPVVRENCEEVRGTEYKSGEERDFFLANCIIPEPASPPNRVNCTNIRGTDYYSPAERNWFLANCIVKEAPKPPTTTTPRSQVQNNTQAQSGNGIVGIISGYYCEQVPGYPIGDGGGFCGNTKSGLKVAPGMAACGSNWALGTPIEIAGWGPATCTDTGLLAPNQVDLFFQTNKDLYTSGYPRQAIVTIR